VKNGTVVDGERFRWCGPPRDVRLASFEKCEAIWVEQIPSVGREFHPLMLHASEDSAKRRQQADPRIQSALQDFLAVLIGGFLKLRHKS
jgi:hypothetical protein